jgi:protein O-GlcNAc transferase
MRFSISPPPLIALGRYAEAEAGFRQALTIRPESAHAHSNLLFCLTHDERVDAAALFAEHCRFGQQFEAPLRAHWTPHSNSRDPERCLQIGFLSPDFRNHAVANFIEPVLAELKNFRQLSLHAYYSHPVEDHVTLRLREHIHHWHPVAGIADTTLADRIRADGIDILIDLSGHTAHHRLQTFAHKTGTATGQLDWLPRHHRPAGHGLLPSRTAFFCLSASFDEQFTEKIVRLPASAPFLPFADAPAVSLLPALSRGHVTFGSFNRPTKISPSVIALWSQLLRAVPNSRMLLGAMRPDGRADQLIEDFARNGVSRDRLRLHSRCDMKTYLTLHQDVDVCLDTFPYTGGTTTLHALWMGVPTLTMAGSTVPGRPGASVLGHVGLEAFIAGNPADFVDQGVASAVNPESLARLRTELRQRLRQSAMGQPQLVAAGLERALRIMWRRWCAQLPAEAFAVDAQDLS